MENKEEQAWDSVIVTRGSLFKLDLAEVWRYRDLLGLMVKRDFVAFYKQTVFGPLWFFVQPLFTTITYFFIFGKLAKLSTDGIPPTLFYLAGITAWSYFSECLTKTANVFRDNANIFGKVYFPRLIIPLSIIVSNLVRFGIQLLLLVILMTYYGIQGSNFNPSLYLLLLPILVFLMAAQGLGLGMIISAMTTKYRDLSLLLNFGIQLLMYGTTVVYPLSELTGTMRILVALNPMTYIIEGMRMGLFGKGSFDLMSLAYVSGISVALLIMGTLIFNKVEKTFVDTV